MIEHDCKSLKHYFVVVVVISEFTCLGKFIVFS